MIPWELKEKIMSSITPQDRNVDRRNFLRMAFAAGANVTCLLCGVVSAQKNRSQQANEQAMAAEQKSLAGIRRPNVVVLLADDLGYQDIGCYGGPVKTPALDGLAAKGVRFTDFYSGCAVCSPSRATLLTGRHHIRTGVYSWISDHHQNSHLVEQEITLAEILKSHGYATAHFGKWHLGLPTRGRNKPTPSQHGFDYWFATSNNASPSHKNPVNFIRNGKPGGKIEGYACQIVVDEAISWLEQHRDRESPFFLNVWFNEPHDPIAAPDEIVSRYGELNDKAAIYSGTIDNTDRAIARLLGRLEEINAIDDTLIIYSSDNGSYLDDRTGGLRGRKGSNYEGGIRVPGIFWWPGTIRQGHVESEPAGLVDVLPTVCGLLGLDLPTHHLDGSDLSPLLMQGNPTSTGREFDRQQPLFWLLPNSVPSIAMRDGKYSLVADRAYELPKDWEQIDAIVEQIEQTLRKNNALHDKRLLELRGRQLFVRSLQGTFSGGVDQEVERLRGQIVRLNMFQESWIPSIKSGSYRRFQLFDLSRDPQQKNDLSTQLPDVLTRLKKKLLEINASVMADAHDWHLK